MATETATNANVFEEVFQNVRKAAEANVKMQQEVFRQWTTFWPGAPTWPGLPTPQTAWLDQVRDFQKDWSRTVSDLAKKHHEVVDRQYQAALSSLDDALRLAEAKHPEEFRKRSEQLCRKTLECMREIAEAQISEFQTAATKWTELMLKAGT